MASGLRHPQRHSHGPAADTGDASEANLPPQAGFSTFRVRSPSVPEVSGEAPGTGGAFPHRSPAGLGRAPRRRGDPPQRADPATAGRPGDSPPPPNKGSRRPAVPRRGSPHAPRPAAPPRAAPEPPPRRSPPLTWVSGRAASLARRRRRGGGSRGPSAEGGRL